LKRFGNWRAKLGDNGSVPKGKLLYRPRSRLNHMADYMVDRETGPVTPGYIPSGRTTLPEARRNFSEADKRRIVEEACHSGGSVLSVARRYGLDTQMLFRWKQKFAVPLPQTETCVLPVTVSDVPAASDGCAQPGLEAGPAAPVIIDRVAPGIEVELVGGRRVRFAPDVDPETVRSLVTCPSSEHLSLKAA
tara:strand:- start:7 stop:579 length:573 start_codon:yes stop_codon:yes gene_type:complete